MRLSQTGHADATCSQAMTFPPGDGKLSFPDGVELPYTLDFESTGTEVYGTIYYVVESPHEAGTIWVGTDDGLVQLTRDGGKSWSDVTPKGLPESLINSIEVSPQDRATAYVVPSGDGT